MRWFGNRNGPRAAAVSYAEADPGEAEEDGEAAEDSEAAEDAEVPAAAPYFSRTSQYRSTSESTASRTSRRPQSAAAHRSLSSTDRP